MGTEADLYIETASPVEKVQATLEQGLGISFPKRDNVVLVNNDLLLFQPRSMDEISQEIKGEGYGFRPTVSVGFRAYGDGNWWVGIADAVDALCSVYTGKSVLLFNGEETICLREKEAGDMLYDGQKYPSFHEALIAKPRRLTYVNQPLPSPLL